MLHFLKKAMWSVLGLASAIFAMFLFTALTGAAVFSYLGIGGLIFGKSTAGMILGPLALIIIATWIYQQLTEKNKK